MEENEKKCRCSKIILIILVLASLIMSAASLFLSLRLQATLTETIKYERNAKIVISRDYDKGQSLDIALEKKKPVIVFAYADWCPHSVKAVPNFKDLSKDKTIKKNFSIAYVNSNRKSDSEIMKKYKIEYLPTVFILQDNNIIAKYSSEKFQDKIFNRKALVEDMMKATFEKE